MWQVRRPEPRRQAGQAAVAKRGWRCVLMMVGAILAAACALAVGNRSSAGEPSVSDSGESFVYLFDPASSTFVFTFTIPTAGADPWDVAVVSGTARREVWFTERGIDRIGRLTYTDTHDYAFREYALPVGSRPWNLAPGGGFIWITEAGRDRIGRLDPATGEIVECAVSPGSSPADLDIAPDGSIWFTEMAADRVARLAMTASGECTLTEYAGGTLAGGRPYGIVVVEDSVFFAQTANDRVTRFTPPGSWIDIKGFESGVPDEPYKLVLDSLGNVWGTERVGNCISRFDYGTLSIVDRHALTPANSLPTGLAADAGQHLWFTQWRAGQIGRLTLGGSPQKDYYRLPLMNLAPTGITIDGQGKIWVLAFRPHYVYLPVVVRLGPNQ